MHRRTPRRSQFGKKLSKDINSGNATTEHYERKLENTSVFSMDMIPTTTC